MFAFLSADPTKVAKREYVAAVAVAAVIGVLCALARMSRKDAEIDSTHSVYEMVDDIVKSYEAAVKATEVPQVKSPMKVLDGPRPSGLKP
jgi:hypothetical protein